MEGAIKSDFNPPTGRIRIESVTKIAEPEFRAVTKIALNYVAAVVGSDVALKAEFNGARDFARYGKERARVRVYPHENPWFIGRKGHYVSLTKADDLIVVQLSILLRVQYFVVLASDASAVPVTATAHFFDLSTKRLTEIDPLPIQRGRPLKAING